MTRRAYAATVTDVAPTPRRRPAVCQLAFFVAAFFVAAFFVVVFFVAAFLAGAFAVDFLDEHPEYADLRV